MEADGDVTQVAIESCFLCRLFFPKGKKCLKSRIKERVHGRFSQRPFLGSGEESRQKPLARHSISSHYRLLYCTILVQSIALFSLSPVREKKRKVQARRKTRLNLIELSQCDCPRFYSSCRAMPICPLTFISFYFPPPPPAPPPPFFCVLATPSISVWLVSPVVPGQFEYKVVFFS